MQENPDAIGTDWFNAISNAMICLAQSESAKTENEACVTKLIRTQVNPDATFGELVDTISNAVICVTRT
jgi:hypothetical protein